MFAEEKYREKKVLCIYDHVKDAQEALDSFVLWCKEQHYDVKTHTNEYTGIFIALLPCIEIAFVGSFQLNVFIRGKKFNMIFDNSQGVECDRYNDHLHTPGGAEFVSDTLEEYVNAVERHTIDINMGAPLPYTGSETEGEKIANAPITSSDNRLIAAILVAGHAAGRNGNSIGTILSNYKYVVKNLEAADGREEE